MVHDRDEASEVNVPPSASGAETDGAGRPADDAPDQEGGQSPEEVAQTGAMSVLEQLGIDLTEIAAGLEISLDGELWEAELRSTKEILERRERHSAVLVGPTGVGKRALVLTLARQIAEGRVPRRLAGRRIIELPFPRVLASVREAGRAP